MGKLNFRKTGVVLEFEDGVNPEYFYANIVLDYRANEIRDLFTKYGYQLSTIPGGFCKAFTGDKEIGEYRESLEEIRNMGLQELFNGNLKLVHFKRAFVNRVKICLQNNIPFLNSDNTFIKALYFEEDFREYVAGRTLKSDDNTNQMTSDEDLETKIASMDEFEIGLYNSVAEKLNYLILANTTNPILVNIINSTIKRFADAILGKDYQYLSTDEILRNIMRDLEIEPESVEGKMILDSVSDIQISVERGRAA